MSLKINSRTLAHFPVRLFYLGLAFVYFCYEIIKSGLVIAKMIISGSRGDGGCIITYHCRLEKHWQKLLLFNMISMTPGTLGVDVDNDGSIFVIHLLNVDDKDHFFKQARIFENLLSKAL